MNENEIKVFLILYFLIYYGILFVLNSFLVFKRTGKNPYVLGKNKGIIRFVEENIKVAGIVIPLVLLIYIFLPHVYWWLIPIHYLEEIYFDYMGISVMVLGFIICLAAQYYMRSSWKIGIELNAEVKLITEGVFGHSRNPFF